MIKQTHPSIMASQHNEHARLSTRSQTALSKWTLTLTVTWRMVCTHKRSEVWMKQHITVVGNSEGISVDDIDSDMENGVYSQTV